MVVISNNISNPLFSIDWKDGIIDITKDGVQHFVDNPTDLIDKQPVGIKFRNEAQKMYEYLKFKKLV